MLWSSNGIQEARKEIGLVQSRWSKKFGGLRCTGYIRLGGSIAVHVSSLHFLVDYLPLGRRWWCFTPRASVSSSITQIVRDPPSLIYPMHLSLPSSYSNKASRNHFLSSSPESTIHPIASTKAWLLPMLPRGTKTSLNTLKGCGKCLGYRPIKCTEMER